MVPRRSSKPALSVFGTRLRGYRTELGLSQERLGELAGLHPTYISSVERGERNLSLLNILRLAHALEVNPADLIEDLTP